MKVLIVEDNRAMRHLIRNVVEELAGSERTEVFECEDGAQALDLYEAHRPDWVLMDIRMQHSNGIETTRKIFELDSQARVIIVTSYDDKGLRAAARAAGACGYVLKEDLSVLRQMITSLP